MRILFVLIVFCASLPSFHLLECAARATAPLQESCSQLFSRSFKHHELASGFLCGTSIQDISTKNSFQKTGLIHLMVVSGGHLQMLSWLLLLPLPEFLRRRKAVVFLLHGILLFYCFMTGFQAPVVRAFISRIVSSMAWFLRWNWDLGKVQIAAGIFALALFPEWIHDFSFYLSWLASLGFLLAPICFVYKKRHSGFSLPQLLLTSALIQSFVAVVFGAFSWLGWILNALLAPALALILFVISAGGLLGSRISALCDWFWDILLKLMDSTLFLAPDLPPFSFAQLNWIFLWFFLLSLQMLFQIIYQQRYLNSDV
jgi:ComEC/Rec2-related protein